MVCGIMSVPTGLIETLEREETECWGNLHAAAQERFYDGVLLATGPEERRLGAIYLFGYVMELLLKTAFYRGCDFERTRVVVPRRDLENHPAWSDARRPLSDAQMGRQPRNLHDLEQLARAVIVLRRRPPSRPYDPVFAGEVIRTVGDVSRHWRESLRYKHAKRDGKTLVSMAQLQEVRAGVSWLLINQERLWS
jgi:hypothetical protein